MWLLLTTTRVFTVSLSLSLTSLTMAARRVRDSAAFCWVRAVMLCTADALTDRTPVEVEYVAATPLLKPADPWPPSRPSRPGVDALVVTEAEVATESPLWNSWATALVTSEMAVELLSVRQLLGLGDLLLGGRGHPAQPVHDGEPGALARTQRQAVQQLTESHRTRRPALGEVQDRAVGDAVEAGLIERRDVDQAAVPLPLRRRL